MAQTTHEILARRVYRIGVQTLERRGTRYYVSIQNRTYRSRVEIPPERVESWQRALGIGGAGWTGEVSHDAPHADTGRWAGVPGRRRNPSGHRHD